MEKLELLVQSNRNGKIILHSGSIINGAVVVSINQEKTNQGICAFIPTEKMIEYQKALETGRTKDSEKIEIDILPDDIKEFIPFN